MLSQYNSAATTKSGRRRKKKDEVSPLVQETFEAFRPFINLYDCGLSAYGGPFHLITKEDGAFFGRYKTGERGLTYDTGDPFGAKSPDAPLEDFVAKFLIIGVPFLVPVANAVREVGRPECSRG